MICRRADRAHWRYREILVISGVLDAIALILQGARVISLNTTVSRFFENITIKATARAAYTPASTRRGYFSEYTYTRKLLIFSLPSRLIDE